MGTLCLSGRECLNYMNLINNLKNKWGIKSNLQLIIIFLVFGITGSVSVLISTLVLDLINLEEVTNLGWIYWLLRIVIIFPIYQILLLVIGTLFGEFNFFKNFIKKMFRR